MAVDFRLYLITDRHVAKKPLPNAVRDALEGGVRAVQLREKDLPVRELLSLAIELRKITTTYGAKLIINERVDIAVGVGADGVHVGHNSMPVAEVRKLVGNSMLIGASTHGKVEATSAQEEEADFITYGPVFETPSKMKYGSPVGIVSLKSVVNCIKLPVFAIGGIKSGNVGPVFSHGAFGVAMISSILAADDIKVASRQIVEQINSFEKTVFRS